VAAVETKQEVRAVAKWVRSSPQKARLVADQIRGRTVPEARTILAFTTKAAARDIEKVLRSAVANAEANHNLVGDTLFVSAAYIDEGPVIKRWRARARGRVARIRKPTCHITVKLSPLDGAAAAPARPAPQPLPAKPEPEAETPQATETKPADKPKPKPRTARKKAEPKADAEKPDKPKRATRTRKKKESDS
jgi:large subunit ribosomal protein L22